MKTLIAILTLFSTTAFGQVAVQVTWTPPTIAQLQADGTVGYWIQHTSNTNSWTNLVYVPTPAASWTSGFSFYQGSHFFRILSTNSAGLLSDPSNVASTNIVWIPAPVTNVTIAVTGTNKTFIIQTQ